MGSPLWRLVAQTGHRVCRNDTVNEHSDSRSEYVIADGEEAGRLDRHLASRLQRLSRSRIQRLINAGQVLVNGQPTTSRYRPQAGDLISVLQPGNEPATPEPENIPLSIIYEDEDILVLNKPEGMVTHPGAGHAHGTLVNALLGYRPELASVALDPLRPGIIHRLDRDTSGVLVVAMNPTAQERLMAQFKARTIEKLYLAVLNGRVTPDRARIDAPIGRDPSNRLRMAVVKDGKRAVTEYVVRQALRGATLTDVRLLTGRTHQIRVHLAYIGHPVIGDSVYGVGSPRDNAYRLLLHAWQLGFVHPRTSESMRFAAPLPERFNDALKELGARHTPGTDDSTESLGVASTGGI